MNKRIYLLLLLCLLFVSACTQDNENTHEVTEQSISEKETQVATEAVSTELTKSNVLRVAGMKGATSMGMAKLIHDERDKNESMYTFEIVTSADEIVPKLLQGEVEIAALPVNVASNLYGKTSGGVRVIAVNTLGVLRVLDTGVGIESVPDLIGKEIMMTGQGTVPEFSLRAILEKYGLSADTDLQIEWKSEPGEVVAHLAKDGGIAILPQPFATAALGKVEGLQSVIDLTEAWETSGLKGQFVTGVFVVRSEFASNNEEAVRQFLADYRTSVEFVKANPKDAGEMIGNLEIVEAPIAAKAIPEMPLVIITGDKMKEAVQGFLEVLWEQDPKSVGGTVPDDEFYFR